MEQGARDRIALLRAWRRGGLASAVAMGALVGTGWLVPAAGLSGVALAALIAAAADLALRRFLLRCALDPDLARIGAVARYRQRRCSPRRRRQLATNLRETAVPSRHALKSEFVAWDRVDLVRAELLALADELEAAESLDPRTMLDLSRLLCDSGLSPLLNRSIPESELYVALRSIRYRLTGAPAGGEPAPYRRGRSWLRRGSVTTEDR